jgi:hypothetical protein
MAKAQSHKTASRKSKSLQRVAAKSAVSKHAGRRVATKPKQAIRDTVCDISAEAAAGKLVSAGRAGSKQAKVLAMLRGSAGGFFAEIVRKKLGLALISDVGEDGRVYRVRGVNRHAV